MSKPEPRRGRTHDAAGTREAILNAAEVIFAEHGFDGARVDAIAKGSGYNSSLIFHYFGDKLGLYAEAVKRADREVTELLARVLAPLLEDESIAASAHAFKAFLEILVTALFDYLVEHPRFVRMLLWEQAEGWQTYSRIVSQLATEDGDQFETLFRRARSAGLLRSGFVPLIQLAMILQICLSYLTFIPLYQMALQPGEDLFSPAALVRARQYIVDFVVGGMMADPAER
jgi:TetR/AcrR family transcriptional regulator